MEYEAADAHSFTQPEQGATRQTSALTLPRCPAKVTSMMFCDESSQKERFFVLGALYFRVESSSDRTAEISSLETRFTNLKAQYGLFGRVKWGKVPTPQQQNKLEGYKSLIRDLASIRDMKFKCMVVDRTKYRLDDKTVCLGDELTGYLKFYTVFLTDGIMVKWPGYFYDITIDNYSFREGQDSNRLKLSVEGRYRKKTGKTYLQRHCDLVTANEEDSNLLQLVDLLTGAVAFCWNGGMLRDSARSSGRKQLVEVIRRSYGGVRLDQQQHRGKFVIWKMEIPVASDPMARKAVPQRTYRG